MQVYPQSISQETVQAALLLLLTVSWHLVNSWLWRVGPWPLEAIVHIESWLGRPPSMIAASKTAPVIPTPGAPYGCGLDLGSGSQGKEILR